MRKNPTNSRHIYMISSLFFLFCLLVNFCTHCAFIVGSFCLFSGFVLLSFFFSFFFHLKETNEKKDHPSGQ